MSIKTTTLRVKRFALERFALTLADVYFSDDYVGARLIATEHPHLAWERAWSLFLFAKKGGDEGQDCVVMNAVTYEIAWGATGPRDLTNGYLPVLRDGEEFVYAHSGERITIAEWLDEYDIDVEIREFAVINLDTDSRVEVV